MIVLDANILLYAYDETASHHAKARPWLERTLSESHPVGLAWQPITAFLRITTDTRLPGQRRTPEAAARIVESWLDQPCVVVLSPGGGYWHHLKRMMVEGQARGPMIGDAQLAALTIEHGGVLHSTDRDFSRFPNLRWTNPRPDYVDPGAHVRIRVTTARRIRCAHWTQNDNRAPDPPKLSRFLR